MMLKAAMRDVIAESVKEVVIAKVVRAEEYFGLHRKVLVVIQHTLRSVQRLGALGCDIHFLGGILT